ncbi:MAG: transposase [Sumerlaeia bacterium]
MRGFDGGKKVKGRKRHILVDMSGRVIGRLVGSAREHDSVAAVELFAQAANRDWERLWKVYGDSAYGGERLRREAEKVGLELEIVKRKEGVKGFVVAAKRWVVERTIAWLSRCRRLAKDYEHLPSSSEAWIDVASIQRLLRGLAG